MTGNMYTGKSSRNPNSPLFAGLLVGAFLIALGVFLYVRLDAWENSNEQLELYPPLWLIYDLGGKLAEFLFFSTLGLVFICFGGKKSQELRKLKKKGKV